MSDEAIPTTAFLIVVPHTGVPYAVNEIPKEPLEVMRAADMADMRRACLEVAADLNARTAAQYVVEALKVMPEAPASKVRSALERRKRVR